MKALLDLFKQVTQEEEFDAIKIALASQKKFVHGLMVKLKSQKRLITEHLNLKEMVYFAQKYLDLLKITNVFAVNINDLNTAVSFVKNVVLKLPYQKCVVSAWVILI